MARSCSSHRRRPPPPVRTREEALTALALAIGAGRSGCVAVGALGDDRRPIALVIVEGARSPDVPAAVDAVLEGTRGGPRPVAALFVATSGAEGEVQGALFDRVERRCARAGVTLLDWLVLADGAAWSAADRAGRRAAW